MISISKLINCIYLCIIFRGRAAELHLMSCLVYILSLLIFICVFYKVSKLNTHM